MSGAKDKEGIAIDSTFGTQADAPAPDTRVGGGGPAAARPAWRVLLVSDLTPGRAPSGPRSVDKNRFAELFRQFAPSLALSVPDPAAAAAARLDAVLEFASLKDFGPDAVAAGVPRPAGLLRMRQAVERFGSGEMAADEFAAALRSLTVPASLAPRIEELLRREAPAPPSTPAPSIATPKSGAVDDLLNLVDTGTKPASVATAMDGLIQAVAGGGGTRARRDVGGALFAVDGLLARFADVLLHDPAFLALEASWPAGRTTCRARCSASSARRGTRARRPTTWSWSRTACRARRRTRNSWRA